MEREIDARGMACPRPVICTKKALEETGSGVIVALVDNETARDNVLKLARSLGCAAEVEERGPDFAVRIRKDWEEACPVPGTDEKAGAGIVVLVPTAAFGRGSGELGDVLMRMFLYTLTEVNSRPAAIILINGGVRLAVEGAETLSSLEALGAAGVEILVCGTCLDYYGLKDKLGTGTVSNMYTITERLLQARRVITIP